MGIRETPRPRGERVYRDRGVRVLPTRTDEGAGGPEEIKASQPPPVSRPARLMAGRSGGPVTSDRLPERGRDGPLASHALQASPLPGRARVPPAGSVEEAAGKPPSALCVTSETFEDLVLVGLQGELDVYTSPAFREHVRRYDPAEVQLVIDLAGVRLLDSAGLGGLVSLRNEVHRNGGRLGLVCPQHDLARLFWVTGLRPAFVFGENLAALRVTLADKTKRPGRSA
jgi:anti-sigma B factor antagonist